MNITTALLSCLKARQPGIHLRTLEEERALEALRQTVAAMRPARPLWSWSMATGITNLSLENEEDDRVTEPQVPLDVALQAFVKEAGPVVLLLLDPWDALQAAFFQRALRETLQHGRGKGKAIVLVGRDWKVPGELADDIHVLDLPLPRASELEEFIRSLCVLYKSSPIGDKIEIDEASIPPLARACTGLTRDETKSIVALSLVAHKAIGPKAVALAIREKSQIVKRTGMLEYEEARHSLADVGGLRNLKSWLLKRGKLFSPEAKARGIRATKGAIFVGPPGTGKTLCARAIAAAWQRPLVKLDAGKLFGSLVGESESNLRMALRTAEAVAPCVLLIDEIEKGFSQSGGNDGGTTQRVFGAFLSWMQDKTADVFVVATANDIDKLDSALVRKGRFDEIFAVDLPDEKAREEILRIHLGSDEFEPVALTTLAQQCNGFTGAELEAAVQDARIDAFNDGDRAVTPADVGEAIHRTVPQSKTMGAQIEALRQFCKSGRARPADGGTIESDAKKQTAGIEL
ncbi:MAG TPA: AAA family ATPase [Planctomycetota bacterium]|jgi:ATP-dependent 26S proteasome regulatory subunit